MLRPAELLARKPWILILGFLGAFVALWVFFVVVAERNKPVFFNPGEQPALPARR